jgi:hypothetical protein
MTLRAFFLMTVGTAGNALMVETAPLPSGSGMAERALAGVMIGRPGLGVTALTIRRSAENRMIHLRQRLPSLCVMANRTQPRADIHMLGGFIIAMTGQTIGRRPKRGVIHPLERFPGCRVVTSRTLVSHGDVPFWFVFPMAGNTIGCVRRGVIHFLQRNPGRLVVAKRTLQPGHVQMASGFRFLMAAGAGDIVKIRVAELFKVVPTF